MSRTQTQSIIFFFKKKKKDWEGKFVLQWINYVDRVCQPSIEATPALARQFNPRAQLFFPKNKNPKMQRERKEIVIKILYNILYSFACWLFGETIGRPKASDQSWWLDHSWVGPGACGPTTVQNCHVSTCCAAWPMILGSDIWFVFFVCTICGLF